MAKFVVDMPDQLASDVVQAFCAEYGYSGENAQEFCQGVIASYMKDVYCNWKRNTAINEAKIAADLASHEIFKDNPIKINPSE